MSNLRGDNSMSKQLSDRSNEATNNRRMNREQLMNKKRQQFLDENSISNLEDFIRANGIDEDDTAKKICMYLFGTLKDNTITVDEKIDAIFPEKMPCYFSIGSFKMFNKDVRNNDLCFNCYECDNCTQCIECKKCVDCDFCVECYDCAFCTNCRNCRNCDLCYDCDDCSRKCLSCKNCCECKNCEECRNCDNCEDCAQCVDCCKCRDCFACSDCYDLYKHRFVNYDDDNYDDDNYDDDN